MIHMIPAYVAKGLIAKDVETVEQFLDKYYKPDRFRKSPHHKDYPDYAETLIANAQRDFSENGFTCISKHDCILGETIYFIG